MKVLAILYHKNILSIYDREWIEDYISSLKNQTFQDFTIYELNYGSDNLNLCEEYDVKNFKYFKKKFDNHADAMNFLFMNGIKDGFDVVFNNNIDDYSHHKRFEIQLEKIKEGYDIVSCNFQFINEIGKISKKMILSNFDIETEIKKEHNIICHPGVCYSRNFIKKNLYDGDEIPKEDLLLWKRTISNFKFHICSEILVLGKRNLFKKLEIFSGKIIEKKVPEKNTYFDVTFVNNSNITFDVCTSCGEPKNKIKYNFCQKCNKLY